MATKKQYTAETWLAKYYPVPVEKLPKRITKLELIRHALRKWLGLRKAVLKRYGLMAQDGAVYTCVFFNGIASADEHVLAINGESCGLCMKYCKTPENTCAKCPLYAVLGNRKCDDDHDYVSMLSFTGPYIIFTRYNDPEPMINMLRKAERVELAHLAKRKQSKA